MLTGQGASPNGRWFRVINYLPSVCRDRLPSLTCKPYCRTFYRKMKTMDWSALSKNYSGVKEVRRETVFPFIRERIRSIRPHRLLDYGGGDGMFAVECADLPVDELVVYDPAPNMAELARKNCAHIPRVKVVRTTQDLQPDSFDVITLNAVWMCLPTEDSCLKVLKDINGLLRPNGYFVASVTHPCFRSYKFSTQSSDFDPANYLKDGLQFNVRIFDGQNEIQVVDTHWTISAMSRQLKDANFVIDEIVELPDKDIEGRPSIGSPWLVLFARKWAIE